MLYCTWHYRKAELTLKNAYMCESSLNWTQVKNSDVFLVDEMLQIKCQVIVSNWHLKWMVEKKKETEGIQDTVH